jgi:alkyl sulfatase BDS1-like metallo-beta-lactamase superfamily hydrolase
MKKLVYLVVLLSLFAFAAPVAAYEPPDPPGAPYVPENVPVNPVLLEQYKEMFPPEVLQVTDGVWVARGYNRDNPALIEGTDGLIVVDPGESIGAAEAGKAAFNAALNNIFDRKPVKAIIYTHHHDCHVNGASVYAGENTEIIGHVNLLSNMYSEWFGQVFPSRAVGGLKMAGALFLDAPVMKLVGDEYQEVPGWYAGYTLGGPQIFGKEGFLPPTKTIGEDTRMTLAGVDVELIPVAGETADVLFVWLPNKKVLIEIAILYEAFPAISTTRGSRQRDPLDYVNSLKVGRSLNPEYLVALHGPNPITRGADEVRKLLTDFSDAIQFLNDQTVQYLNRGFTPGEMEERIVLPPHLASSPYLEETYGSKEWDVFHIFRYYRGLYTGEVRDLFPQTTESEARMSEFLSKGGGDLAKKAQKAFDAGELEWALRIADDALVVNKDNQKSKAYKDAFETKKAAMLALAEQTMNSQARNMLLSDYLLMTDQVDTTRFHFGDPRVAFASINATGVELMPMSTLHRIMAVNLNAGKAIPVDETIGLQLTDIKKNDPEAPDHYTLNVRKGILEVNPPGAGNEQFVINTNSLTWKELVLYKVLPETAVGDERVVISGGSPESFYAFMDLFR